MYLARWRSFARFICLFARDNYPWSAYLVFLTFDVFNRACDPTAAQVLLAVTDQAKKTKHLSAMRVVAPGGGVRTIDLLLDTATGRCISESLCHLRCTSNMPVCGGDTTTRGFGTIYHPDGAVRYTASRSYSMMRVVTQYIVGAVAIVPFAGRVSLHDYVEAVHLNTQYESTLSDGTVLAASATAAGGAQNATTKKKKGIKVCAVSGACPLLNHGTDACHSTPLC